MSRKVEGVGESPAMLHHNGRYYWFSSHTTSWERNDNMYVSSASLSGPWEKKPLFAPRGSNTWNTQTSFILPVVNQGDTTVMYMGDRWSYPRQRSAATYVWQPLQWIDGEPFMPEFMQAWSPATIQAVELHTSPLKDSEWNGKTPGDSKSYRIRLDRPGKIYIKGLTDDHSAYAEAIITDSRGNIKVRTSIDFYSLAPAEGLRYISPMLDKGEYDLTITVSTMKPNWSDKKRNLFGSHGYNVSVSEAGILLP